MLFAPFTQNRLKASCTKRLQDRTERIVALRRYSSEMDECNASMKMSALLTISFGTLPRALGEARHSGGKNCHRRARLVVNVCGWNSVQPAIRLPSTMIITSGSLAGQGAAITLTVIYGTLRSRVRGAGNIPEPANSAAIPHFISNGMFECHPGSEWVDLKAVKKRTQNPLLGRTAGGRCGFSRET